MLFHKIDFAKIILNQYAEIWFIWIGFFILGILLVKYSRNLALTKKQTNKMASTGAGLIAITLVIHFGLLIVVIYKSYCN